jgi:hypothetical protein
MGFAVSFYSAESRNPENICQENADLGCFHDMPCACHLSRNPRKGGKGGRGGYGGIGMPDGSSGHDGMNGESGNGGRISITCDPQANHL